MRVLLAVESVTTLDILLDEMMTRAWPSGTEARVLSVVEDGEVPLEIWREEGYGIAAVRHEMRRRGEQTTALAAERLRQIGIPAEIMITRGNPEFLISFVARNWPADLIVIRAHNRTDFRNWMLGSVAKSVVENAPCSVEVVRAAGEEPSVARTRSARMLFATDGSAASLVAAQAIAESTWPADSEVKVVSVVDPIIYSLEELGFLSDKGTNRAHRAIGEALQVLGNAPFKISGEVIAGSAARQIIGRAREWNADLIVVGTHARRGLKRLLLGGTSAVVASRAHCSVRVIRGRGVSQHKESLPHRSGPSAKGVGRVYRLDESVGSRKAA